MNPDDRLGEIITALESAGVDCLVVGGHAVRFHGLWRNTDDFDLHVSPACWDDLPERLAQCGAFSAVLVEGPSWRRGVFRRFRIGTLSTGTEEWLEFWRTNHLLGPFDQLKSRSIQGRYGSRNIRFLGIGDLIRSKETERDQDWQDVSRLEEFQDARMLAKSNQGLIPLAVALASCRSRAGFTSYLQANAFSNPNLVTEALSASTNPIAQSYLLPFCPGATLAADSVMAIEPMLLTRLRSEIPGGRMHHSIVEIVRRRYIELRREQDRQDKQASLKAQ